MLFAGAWPVNSNFIEWCFAALDYAAPVLGIPAMTQEERRFESNKIIFWFYDILNPTIPAVAYAFYFGL